jgi:methionine-rich copper-binding protein CopC
MTSQYLRVGGVLTGPTLQQAVFAGTVNPRNIVAVREILHGTDANAVDTALFSGNSVNYDVAVIGDTVTVTDTTGVDGVDTLRNVERLQFADETLTPTAPSAPVIVAVIAGNGSARVNFTAGAAQGPPVQEFKIQAIVSGDVVRTVNGIAPTATSAEVDGLDNGKSYRFKVVAVNKLGLSSEPSAPSPVVVPVAPVPPVPPVPPTVVGSTPASGASVFAVTGNLTVTFDKSVTSSDFAAATTLRNNATLTNLAALVTYDDATRTLTINPNADLTPGTSYTLTVSGAGPNGIHDSLGTALPTTAITFTATPDRTAPSVTSVSPVGGAKGVGFRTNVVARFSERVQGVSTITAVLTNRRTGAVVRAVVTVNSAGTRLTLNPRAKLARKTVYTLTLKGGATAIRDMSGNSLAPFKTHFRTRP